jgi:hypothetical protein
MFTLVDFNEDMVYQVIVGEDFGLYSGFVLMRVVMTPPAVSG